MFARLLSTSLLFVLLAGCGLTPAAPRTPTTPSTRAADYTGSYLALCFEPSQEITDTAARLRQQLGFVDLSRAIPPRKDDELHVTLAYFRKLEPYQAERLAQHFRGKETYLYIDGYGVANGQAAYFTIQGTEEARAIVGGMNLPFSADDPHATFGVSPGNPRDVHGVPKKPQQSLSPYKFLASYHLQQGTRNIW